VVTKALLLITAAMPLLATCSKGKAPQAAAAEQQDSSKEEQLVSFLIDGKLHR
jgi:hypothetical protein